MGQTVSPLEFWNKERHIWRTGIIAQPIFCLWDISFKYENKQNYTNIQKRVKRFLKKRTHVFTAVSFPTEIFNYSCCYSFNRYNQKWDKGNYVCGIFVDFQKGFHTVDHHILIKRNWKARNKWFASYISNRKQFVSLNGYNFNLADFKCGVPQGSIQEPLFYLHKWFTSRNRIFHSILICRWY